MTNRVLLDGAGLRISKPGVNVIGASLGNLNFNSDWAQMGLYRQGSYNFNWSGSPAINLGKTFPTPPLVSYVVTGSNATYGDFSASGIGGFSNYYFEDNLGDNGTENRYFWIVGRATTTQIILEWQWQKYVSGDPSPPNLVIDYSIWEYNL